jgi:hypothetical protein
MTLKTNPNQLQTCEVSQLSQLSQGVQFLKMKLMRGFQVLQTTRHQIQIVGAGQTAPR